MSILSTINSVQTLANKFIFASNSLSVLAGLLGATPVKWGVFDTSGTSIAIFDSVLRVSYSNSSRVSNYPVEEGAFATYNKVADPFGIQIVCACGGSESARSDFIAALDAAANSTDVYNVLLPETSYFNLNVERVDWERSTTSGAGIVIATLYMVEVRETATAAYSSPASPDAQDPTQQGQLQPAIPDVSESALAEAGSYA